jgi:hypothetical protein
MRKEKLRNANTECSEAIESVLPVTTRYSLPSEKHGEQELLTYHLLSGIGSITSRWMRSEPRRDNDVGREQGGGRGKGHTTNVVLEYLMGEEELHCDLRLRVVRRSSLHRDSF